MKILSLGFAALLALSSPASRADTATREFVMSCTYGAAAGALVGAASLAFTSQPGKNLNHVARGASLGLYIGILLGVYVVYIIPGIDDRRDEDPVALAEKVPFTVAPTFGLNNRIDGAKADLTLLHF